MQFAKTKIAQSISIYDTINHTLCLNIYLMQSGIVQNSKKILTQGENEIHVKMIK